MAAAGGARRRSPDLLFHMWLDNCLTPGLSTWLTDRIVPYHWSGLYFTPGICARPWPCHPCGGGSWPATQRCTRPAAPRWPCWTKGLHHAGRRLGGKPVIAFPDIADSDSTGSGLCPRPGDGARAGGALVVALLGALSRRKGAALLMEVARLYRQTSTFSVFAGVWISNPTR